MHWSCLWLLGICSGIIIPTILAYAFHVYEMLHDMDSLV